MKKSLSILFSLLLLAACDGEKTYVVGKNALCSGLDESSDESVFCIDSEKNPINGRVLQYYDNGKIFREMTIRGGRENGIEREFYENGNMHVVANVVNGKTDGESILYNEDGSINMKIYWKSGVLESVSVYDENGNIIESVAE